MVPTSSLNPGVRGRIGPVDAIDRKIIALLQADGRLTLTDLADRVGLSVSPCHRRLRELERGGVITGYRAVVNPAALGLTFEALVFVTMAQEDRDTLQAFEAGLAAIPNVVSAERLFGDRTTCCGFSPPTSPLTTRCRTGSSASCPAYSA